MVEDCCSIINAVSCVFGGCCFENGSPVGLRQDEAFSGVFCLISEACYSRVARGDERASLPPLRRVRARVVIPWDGGAGRAVLAVVAGRRVPMVFDVVSLRGRPGRRAVIGGALGGRAEVGCAAALMAASTSGRHFTRFGTPGWRPFGFGRLMSKTGGGDPGTLGGGGLGGRTVALMMLSYVGGRMYLSPPPLLRAGFRAQV
jgi:hypothetical protein